MRVLFRVDASPSIGGGHAIRCLALAEALAESGAQVTFASAEMLPSLDRELAARGIARLNPGDAARSAFDWIVVDHYRLDADWERPLRAGGARILVIDDLCDRPHDCNLLVDPTFGRAAADYASRVPPGCQILTGPRYAFLRPSFAALRPRALARRRQPRPAERLLISLGLTDVGGITLPVVEAALACGALAQIDVAIGSNGPSVPALRALARSTPRLRIHLDSVRMAELMAAADIGIGAAGSSSWERCCLGLPAIALVVAENQRTIAERLDAAGAALAATLDDVPATLLALIEDGALRLALSAAGAPLADGLGTRRVAGAMMHGAERETPGPLGIRRAGPDDSELLWLWRNDPDTRAASQSPAAVPWPDHAAWFERVLGDAGRHLFIAERDGAPLGMVRFDPLGEGRGYEVSINLAPDARGRGTGTAVLGAACRHFAGEIGPARLEAAIHRDNRASQRVFAASGFGPASALGADAFGRYVRLPETVASGDTGARA